MKEVGSYVPIFIQRDKGDAMDTRKISFPYLFEMALGGEVMYTLQKVSVVYYSANHFVTDIFIHPLFSFTLDDSGESPRSTNKDCRQYLSVYALYKIVGRRD